LFLPQQQVWITAKLEDVPAFLRPLIATRKTAK